MHGYKWLIVHAPVRLTFKHNVMSVRALRIISKNAPARCVTTFRPCTRLRFTYSGVSSQVLLTTLKNVMHEAVVLNGAKHWVAGLRHQVYVGGLTAFIHVIRKRR